MRISARTSIRLAILDSSVACIISGAINLRLANRLITSWSRCILRMAIFRPVLDIEHKPDDKSVEDFQRDVLTWLHIVEDRYHVKPIIYTYYKFKEQYLSAPVFDDYPYWIAHYYVDKVQYKGKWKFWQHTDAGKFPGIKGYVDFNIYNGSYYDLEPALHRKQ